MNSSDKPASVTTRLIKCIAISSAGIGVAVAIAGLNIAMAIRSIVSCHL